MRLHLRRNHGQSLVLLVLLMLVLIGFVGLSVDVGNAYGQQRRLQNAANGGALGAMNAWLQNKSNTTPLNNSKVWENIRKSLAGNRIGVTELDGSF